LRIGFDGDSLQGWHAGVDLFRILLNCLEVARSPDDEITVIAHASRDAFPWRILRVGKHMITSFSCDRQWISSELKRIPRKKLIRETVGKAMKLEMFPTVESKFSRALSEFDVIGPLIYPPKGCHAWLGYIADCQHRRLPHLFSEAERSARDAQWSRMLQSAPVLIVTSEDTKADLTKYFSPVQAEIIALPFLASADPKWFDVNATKVREKYRLPIDYFLCSNRFWMHKNHDVIFEALALAKSEGKSLCVVFTGEMNDYRNSSYAGTLGARVQTLGISDVCHFLGLIPKLDQIAIMREAIAVIQPTLFEGSPGGLAICDAVSLGQRVILSDIPVNREIQQYVDEYFLPDKPRALFASMCRVKGEARPKIDRDTLLREGRDRSRHCGTVLWDAFALAAERRSDRIVRSGF
jgi:glycosyltransferase involved in cell wall biosynthesis